VHRSHTGGCRPGSWPVGSIEQCLQVPLPCMMLAEDEVLGCLAQVWWGKWMNIEVAVKEHHLPSGTAVTAGAGSAGAVSGPVPCMSPAPVLTSYSANGGP